MKSQFPFMGRLSLCFALALCCAGLQAQQQPTELFNLFEALDDVPADIPAPKPFIILRRPALVRLDLLDRMHAGERLLLNLFPNEVFVGVIERIEKRSERRYSCFGRLEGFPLAWFVLVVEEDVMVGTIQVPTQSLLFQIRYAGDAVHLVSQVDENQLPLCGGGIPLQNAPAGGADPKQPQPAPPQVAPPSDEDNDGEDPLAGCSPPAPVFDMLIVYTQVARQAAGGANAINAICQEAIDLTNVAYSNSLIKARVRLVARREINYNEQGTYEDHLKRLTNPLDGFMDNVHAMRNVYRADQVTLLVDDGEFCGLGWCMSNSSRAFTIVTWYCVDTQTYAHEFGHNQGCNHDRENASDGCSAFPFSYGWRFNGESGNQFRTIMSYPPGARIPHLSNPDVFFDNRRTGVSIGQENEAHNVATINFFTPMIEDFKLTRFDIWVDFAHGGAELGTFDFPFDTVAEGVASIITGVGASELPNLWIKTGATSETITISKPMTMRACGGTVRIGG